MITDEQVTTIKIGSIAPTDSNEGGAIKLNIVGKQGKNLGHFLLTLPEAASLVQGLIVCMADVQKAGEARLMLQRVPTEGRA